MGWQDRDWAKFDDRELEQLYGVRRGRSIGLRPGVTLAIAVSVLATLVLGRTHLLRLHSPATSVDSVYPQHVIYGVRGTDAAAPNEADGTNTVCTAASFDPTQGWQCQTWAIDLAGLPIAAARNYDGTCANAKVDQTSGAWVCISATPSQPVAPSVPS